MKFLCPFWKKVTSPLHFLDQLLANHCSTYNLETFHFLTEVVFEKYSKTNKNQLSFFQVYIYTNVCTQASQKEWSAVFIILIRKKGPWRFFPCLSKSKCKEEKLLLMTSSTQQDVILFPGVKRIIKKKPSQILVHWYIESGNQHQLASSRNSIQYFV